MVRGKIGCWQRYSPSHNTYVWKKIQLKILKCMHHPLSEYHNSKYYIIVLKKDFPIWIFVWVFFFIVLFYLVNSQIKRLFWRLMIQDWNHVGCKFEHRLVVSAFSILIKFKAGLTNAKHNPIPCFFPYEF